MRLIIILLFIIQYGISAQETFIKVYDREETRTGRQLEKYENRYFGLATGVCYGAGECCEVIELDTNGNILWSKRLPWIDPSSRSMVIYNDTIAISGNHNPEQTEFYLHQMSINGGDSLATYTIDHDSINLQDMYQLSTIIYNGKIVIAGSAKLIDTAYAIMYIVDKSGAVDSLFIADQNDRNTDIWRVFEDHDGNLVAFFDQQYKNGDNVRSIKKYNDKLEEIWSYTTESLLVNPSNPKGTELKDGRIAFTYGSSFEQYQTPSVRVVNPDMTIDWQYDWSESNSIGRYLYNIETAEDGSIFAMGDLTDLTHSPYIRKAPFIIKISADGELIWERAYIENDVNGDNKQGLIYDIEELDDGSMMAIGNLFNDNGDILLLKLDADGCLIDGCGDLVNLTSSKDLPLDEIGLTIYPNPARNSLHLDTDLDLNHMQLRDVTGQQYYTGPYHDKLDVSQFPSGVYLLSVSVEDGRQFYKRVVVE